VAKAWVITVSDSCFGGDAEDRSGPSIAELLAANGLEVAGRDLVPDEQPRIAAAIRSGIAAGADLVVTTGGTGLAERDVTPQATLPLLDYEIPGFGEEMRRAGAVKTPNALLSRSLAGVAGKTLVINLPGSVSGATESLDAVLPVIGHALRLLSGDTGH
jgi:molybdenum cofactor synthesis domain-containing protein